MKLIIVNDMNGHCNAYKYNLVNMRALLRLVLDANKINTMMEDPGVGEILLLDPITTADQIKSFMCEDNGPVDRSGGGHIYFIESEDELNLPDHTPNPFT